MFRLLMKKMEHFFGGVPFIEMRNFVFLHEILTVLVFLVILVLLIGTCIFIVFFLRFLRVAISIISGAA